MLSATDLPIQNAPTSLRDRFSNEEWAIVRSAPFAAGLMVAAADPSGVIGSIEEASALHNVIFEVAKGATPGSLVALVTDPEQFGPFDEDITISPRSSPELFLNHIREALALVLARTAGEIEAYRNLILSAAEITAEASKEGGILGIGGKLISAEEESTLEALRTAVMD